MRPGRRPRQHPARLPSSRQSLCEPVLGDFARLGHNVHFASVPRPASMTRSRSAGLAINAMLRVSQYPPRAGPACDIDSGIGQATPLQYSRASDRGRLTAARFASGADVTSATASSAIMAPSSTVRSSPRTAGRVASMSSEQVGPGRRRSPPLVWSHIARGWGATKIPPY
jgi:hypothetical protein